jgi:hypothetical protein
MRKKICVIGNGVQIAHELADVTDQVRGADVVVLAGETDLAAIRDSAPASSVLVVGDEARCQETLDALLFPRARVFGVSEGDAAAAAEAVAFERGSEHDVLAQVDGGFGPHRARLGRGGITELL